MKILYIQHATEYGGSVISLKNQLLELKNNYSDVQITILLVKNNKKISDYYTSYGFEVIFFKNIYTFEHTTAKYYNVLNPLSLFFFIGHFLAIPISIYRTLQAINKIKPDIVHLNSAVLLPSAFAVKLSNRKLIWHIRENPYFGFLKIRFSIFSYIINKISDSIIFICYSDRESWKGGAKSNVIYNFVDLEVFTPSSRINFSCNIVLLYLGGVNKIKGFIVLLKSLVALRDVYGIQNIRVLCPGLLYKTPSTFTYKFFSKISSLFLIYPNSNKIERFIKLNNLESILFRTEFKLDVVSLFKLSDLVIFPSISPHFARPIIEASAMGLPAIGSNLAGVRELINNNVTGLLFQPSNHCDLASKVNILINNRELYAGMKIASRVLAEKRYDVHSNVKKIYSIYRIYC